MKLLNRLNTEYEYLISAKISFNKRFGIMYVIYYMYSTHSRQLE